MLKFYYADNGEAFAIKIQKNGIWVSVPVRRNVANSGIEFDTSDPLYEGLISEVVTDPDYADSKLSDRTPTPETPQPDWKQFRRGMWPDAGYRRLVRDTADKEGRIDLKIAAGVGTEDYTWLKLLWDTCVNGLVVKPSTAEIDSWKAIATSAAMSLSFGSDGKMILL